MLPILNLSGHILCWNVIVIMKLCQNSVQILLKPAGMGYFPRTSFARQNYEMMITKTVMSLTFRNEDNRNSLGSTGILAWVGRSTHFRMYLSLLVLLITNKNAAVMRSPFNSKRTAVSVPRPEFHPGIIGWALIEANLWSPLSSLESYEWNY